MANFLDRLAERTLETAPIVRPVIAPAYAAAPAAVAPPLREARREPIDPLGANDMLEEDVVMDAPVESGPLKAQSAPSTPTPRRRRQRAAAQSDETPLLIEREEETATDDSLTAMASRSDRPRRTRSRIEQHDVHEADASPVVPEPIEPPKPRRAKREVRHQEPEAGRFDHERVEQVTQAPRQPALVPDHPRQEPARREQVVTEVRTERRVESIVERSVEVERVRERLVEREEPSRREREMHAVAIVPEERGVRSSEGETHRERTREIEAVRPLVAQPQMIAPFETSRASRPEHEPVDDHIATPPPAPTIHVTIGRIEIRATQTGTPAPSHGRASAPVMSLDDYLRQRSGGRS